MRRLEPGMFVSGQITAEEVAELAAAGLTLIVNNRPDGEEPGQPTAAEIAAAAEAAGIAYRHIPVAGLNAAQVPAMAEALASAEGNTLAFCRSGTRSTYLWALARATQGADRDMLIGKAAEAGYDLTPIARFL
ncbi:TIGR01244 family protein [Allosphingosinicella indica]|uniref:TIGR01244 family protein n=2 Tax=Allosphingosinicella indica TaxID=941907 RepID=A0A1X7G5F6_9SPHN|nr:TIGR01244 family protein [Allosphingosinicella indica]